MPACGSPPPGWAQPPTVNRPVEPGGHHRRQGHRLVVLRGESRVVGPQNRDRGVRVPRRRAEEGVQLRVTVARMDHRAMCGALGAGTAQGEQHGQPAGRGGLWPYLAVAPHRGPLRQPVQDARRDTGHHEVRLRDRPVGEFHPRRPAVLLQHTGDVGAEVKLDLPGQTPLVHRPGQLAQSAAHVPGAEGVLQVRQYGRARRGDPGIQAVAEGMALQERREPGVAQLPGAELGEGGGPASAQQPLVRHRRVGLTLGQHLPVRPQWLLQQRAAGPVPGLAGPHQEVAPALPCARAERLVQGGHGARARGVRQ